jgi:hypothetical protein
VTTLNQVMYLPFYWGNCLTSPLLVAANNYISGICEFIATTVFRLEISLAGVEWVESSIERAPNLTTRKAIPAGRQIARKNVQKPPIKR